MSSVSFFFLKGAVFVTQRIDSFETQQIEGLIKYVCRLRMYWVKLTARTSWEF